MVRRTDGRVLEERRDDPGAHGPARGGGGRLPACRRDLPRAGVPIGRGCLAGPRTRVRGAGPRESPAGPRPPRRGGGRVRPVHRDRATVARSGPPSRGPPPLADAYWEFGGFLLETGLRDRARALFRRAIDLYGEVIAEIPPLDHRADPGGTGGARAFLGRPAPRPAVHPGRPAPRNWRGPSSPSCPLACSIASPCRSSSAARPRSTRRIGLPSCADHAFRPSAFILAKLAEADPDVADYRRSLGACLIEHAACLRGSGRPGIGRRLPPSDRDPRTALRRLPGPPRVSKAPRDLPCGTRRAAPHRRAGAVERSTAAGGGPACRRPAPRRDDPG